MKITPVKKFSSMTNEKLVQRGSPTFQSNKAYYQYDKVKTKFELLRYDCRENFTKFDKIVLQKVSTIFQALNKIQSLRISYITFWCFQGKGYSNEEIKKYQRNQAYQISQIFRKKQVKQNIEESKSGITLSIRENAVRSVQQNLIKIEINALKTLQKDIQEKTFVKEVAYQSDEEEKTQRRILPFGMQIRAAA